MEINIKENDGTTSFIKYIPNFLNQEYIQILHKEISDDNYIGGDTDYGSEIPRVQKWMHNNNLPFSLLWKKQYKRWQPQPYSLNVKKIQNELTKIYLDKYILPEGVNIPNINSALINKYRDGNDSIAFHRDNLPEFGENPTIMVLSLGYTRQIKFRRVLYNPEKPKSMKTDKDNKNMNFNINLENGSLLVMGGSTQKFFAHGIDKQDCKGERYSITFREHIPIGNDFI